MGQLSKQRGSPNIVVKISCGEPQIKVEAAQPVRCFNLSREVIRLAVLMYVRFPLSLRNLLFERGIDIWWNRFRPHVRGQHRRLRINRMRGFARLRWQLDDMYVKINGEMV